MPAAAGVEDKIASVEASDPASLAALALSGTSGSLQASKGEASKQHKGRTITVVDATTGGWLNSVVYGGRGVDHLVLSPDGTEIWASSNDSGTVYVIDVETRETTVAIALPQFGDAHGF